MRVSTATTTFSVFAAAVFLAAGTSLAGPPVPLTQDVTDALSGPVRAGEHVVVPRLTLDDGSTVSLDLEAFEVFAPGASIIEYTGTRRRRLPPPQDHYLRGGVMGDLDSLVVLASGPTVRGFVYTKGKLYTIAPDRDVYADDRPDPVARLRMLDPERDRPPDASFFHCDSESLPKPPPESGSVTALGMPISVQPMWTSTVYTVNLAIETDYEFYQKFGSTSGELRYIGDLTAAASAIYWRDVKSVFQIGTVHLYSSASDPWTVTSDTLNALYELGDYWHANWSSVQRTTVHMLSGKGLGGGIAWLGVLCDADFSYSGHWGGAYGLSASLAGQFSTTNPSLYWDIYCFSHEIGHNFNSPHTHCYTPPVDHCWNSESGCYSGPLCANGSSDPCTGGTIMSYCHMRSGGYSNLILYFGQPGQLNQAVADQMRGYLESISSCLGPLAAAPTVTGINPNVGSTGGGTPVTISGTGFQNVATVTIGGVNATNVTIVSSTSITATTGAHTTGTVDVVVKNPDSQTGTLTNGYTYGACSAPSTPTLSAPASAASGAIYTVSWSGTRGDNTYEVQESTNPGFAGAGTIAVTGTGMIFTHVVVGSVTYYYRVRAKITCGGSAYFSSWSSSGHTVVTAPPGCAVVLSNQTITSTQDYTSCGTLTAGPAFRLASPANVTFRAAFRVDLSNGLSVGSGATFRAGIDPSLAP
jgi:hypothetical protein